MDPATQLSGALLASLRRDGIEPDRSLALLRSAAVPADPVDGPAALGTRHEQLMAPAQRRRRGAWYTPATLAARLVEHAVPDCAAAERGPVVDPACGGGAVLLAAADRLLSLGWSPGAAVAHLHGRDIDPVAVAVAEAALWWWSARHGDAARPAGLLVADALAPGRRFVDESSRVLSSCRIVDESLPKPSWEGRRPGTVVGNPPFLGQLRRGTAIDAQRRAALRARFGAAVGAYTDPAWLFLLQAVGDVAPGGRVALVQPRSVLAARDAGAIRDRIDHHARLVTTLLPEEPGFDAAVAVCVPVLERTESSSPNDWVGCLADAASVPRVEPTGDVRLGDIAGTHAGFRDEFYGLTGAVRAGGPGPRLVTAGAIDPLRLLDRPQRFAGRRWNDARVDVAALEGRARRWVEVQARPKVLVSSQTRVLEVVADPDGELVGSVPVVVLVPHDESDVWHLAAALTAPTASAWVLRRSAGTGRSVDACRPTAALLAALPLPADRRCWDEAAQLAEAASRGRASVRDVAVAAERAYQAEDSSVLAWWEGRRPQR